MVVKVFGLEPTWRIRIAWSSCRSNYDISFFLHFSLSFFLLLFSSSLPFLPPFQKLETHLYFPSHCIVYRLNSFSDPDIPNYPHFAVRTLIIGSIFLTCCTITPLVFFTLHVSFSYPVFYHLLYLYFDLSRISVLYWFILP